MAAAVFTMESHHKMQRMVSGGVDNALTHLVEAHGLSFEKDIGRCCREQRLKALVVFKQQLH